jgi:protein involved in polysaccharide export with SLBB domain
MRSRPLGALLVVLLSIGAASAQNQSDETLQALKDSVPQDQQNSILQQILGKDGIGNNSQKTDKQLSTPQTVQPGTNQQRDSIDIKDQKTSDGRVLRQLNQDPELRLDDTVLIDLIPLEEICGNRALAGQQNGNAGNNPSGPPNGTSVPGGNAALSSLGALAGAGGIPGINGMAGANGTNGTNGTNTNTYDLTRCPPPPDNMKPGVEKTDLEKADSETFRKRILSSNPYKLNHVGVLEIPGIPPIPMAGLTASEATKRLDSDPALADYFVKLTLLRLRPTGQEALKPFGYDLFEGVPSTFAPVSDIQVPIDYLIGPGDTFEIQLYGNEPAIYKLTVQRDGRINFPKLGPIPVSGMSFDDARGVIEEHVSKQLIGSRVSVTIGDLRSIRVFVLGEANKPGSYTVSGLSTMTNALFVSGGVKKIGSLRNIELKRNGRLVTTLDLYDLLLNGDTSGDRQLMPGDVIFIPPIGRTVSVDGAVRRPAIYELKTENTAEQAVKIAGGLAPDADAKLGQLERILPSKLREMHNVDLTTSVGREVPLDNGDTLKVPSIRPTLENSVELTGYVFRPGAFAYHPGLRLTDVLESFDELRPEADVHYIMIRREVPPEQNVEVISADLRRALAARGSAADPELRPRDKIYVFSLSASRERILQPILRDLELQANPDTPEQVVSVEGRVKAPGKYPLEPAMHVSDLIRAGGSLEAAAYRGQAELTRYAVVDGEMRKTELIPVNLAGIWRGTPGADVQMKPYDVLVIKPIPMWMEPGTIEVAGEVRFPGKYPIHQGETLYSVLQRAGGFTDAAFPYGAVFVREELKKREKDQLEALSNRLQSDLAALSLEAVASSGLSGGGGGAANASQALIIGQQLLGQLRDTKPVGRLVIDVQGILHGQPGGPEDVVVRDGDKLIVPKQTQEVTILGEVQSPTSHVYEKGLTRNDYIAKSGGATQKADRARIYVVRANGDVVAGGRSGWFRRTQSIEMRPGDTIVVPLDTERVNKLAIWQAVTTIIYNLAIGFVLVHQYL